MNSTFSKIGFGCYRIDDRYEEHYNALYKALEEGITLIDTSSNYSDGGSEKLVGKVVNELIKEGKIKREDLTIVTKAGYIQGQNYRLAAKLKKDDKPFPEVVEFDEKLWHSISPDFIEDQLNRQLQRLNQNYVDVYLLHNPEYYLGWAKKINMNLNDAREIYYERIRKAFEFLEEKVKEGKINLYGISSNTFVSHSGEHDFTSLEKTIDVANSISLNNHFKVIQLPFNLFEAGAILNKNQINNTETVLEMAAKINLKVLVNRPLNAITSKGLVRLAEFKAEPFEERDFIKQMKLISLMEDDLINEKLVSENLSEEDLNKVKKLLAFGNLVEENWKFFGSIEHFNDVVSQLLAPKIDFLINFFDEKIDNENIKDFFGRYIKECYKLLNFVSNYYKLRADKRSNYINTMIDKDLDPKFKNLSLSQKAIMLLSSVDGVNFVLIGMRKEKYVDDILNIPGDEKIENAKKIIMNVSREIEMFQG
ncbi:MAG: aldo/keto reductase [Bacteroidota bacterium]|nr:aldo/keto reductase [Bacteroidota bacterium]